MKFRHFAPALAAVLAAPAALAHSGHLAPEAGHSHGTELIALLAAGLVVAALVSALRGRI